MRVVMMTVMLALLAGCWEDQGDKVKREICSEIDRQTAEALATRDRANGGLTGGAKTPRVPTCTE